MSRERRILNTQADLIEAVFYKHKIRAQITGGILSPRSIRFTVSTVLGEKIQRIKALSEEIALALGAQSARIARTANGLTVNVPRNDPQIVSLEDLLNGIPNPGAGMAVLGLCANGVPLVTKLDSPQVAHVLLAGTTGSGKSDLLKSMIISMLAWSQPSELALVLIDPKGTELQCFSGVPHLNSPIITDPAEAAKVLRVLAVAMDRDATWNRIVVVIDELADLCMTAGRPAIHALTRITQRGRSVGLHVIAATQKPTVDALGSLVKANFPLRLVGRVTSAAEAQVASGYAGTGAEHLQAPGEFLAVTGGDLTQFSAAYIRPGRIPALLERLCGPAAIAHDQPVIQLLSYQHEYSPYVNTSPEEPDLTVARKEWLFWRDGAGSLKRGGNIAVARALFGPDATGAGHQFRAVKQAVADFEKDFNEAEGGKALEPQALAPGTDLSLDLPAKGRVSHRPIQADPCPILKRPLDDTTTRAPCFLRPKGQDWRAQRVVVMFKEGHVSTAGSLMAIENYHAKIRQVWADYVAYQKYYDDCHEDWRKGQEGE